MTEGVGVGVPEGVGEGVGEVTAFPTCSPAAVAAARAEVSDEIQALEIWDAPETPVMLALWAARASEVNVGIAKAA